MSSHTDSNNKREELLECFKKHQAEIHEFRRLIRGKDIIVPFGMTRSGKSTLVNYLIGTELQGFETDRKIYKIFSNSNNHAEIGQGALSCTFLPRIFQIPNSTNTYIMDPPGCEDNRGITQDTANALTFNQIQYARSVKFVLVFDINDVIHDNIRNFVKTLEYVQQLVSNFDELKHSFCFIFTKDDREYSGHDIAQLLNTNILNVEGFNFDKRLIRNIVANEKAIGIFRMPNRSGVISNTIDVNVKGAIQHAHLLDTEKCKINCAISDVANKTLLQIYPEYTGANYFNGAIAQLTRTLSEYFDVDKYVYASYDEELERTLQTLTNIRKFIKDEVLKEFGTLRDVEDSLDTLFLNVLNEATLWNNFCSNFEFVLAMDDSMLLEPEIRNKIIKNYKASLDCEVLRVYRLIDKINAEMENRESTKFKYNACIAGGVLSGVMVIPAVVRAGAQLLATETAAASAVVAAEATATTALGTAITVAGAVGVAGVAAAIGGFVVSYRELYTKRNKAREQQGRPF